MNDENWTYLIGECNLAKRKKNVNTDKYYVTLLDYKNQWIIALKGSPRVCSVHSGRLTVLLCCEEKAGTGFQGRGVEGSKPARFVRKE